MSDAEPRTSCCRSSRTSLRIVVLLLLLGATAGVWCLRQFLGGHQAMARVLDRQLMVHLRDAQIEHGAMAAIRALDGHYSIRKLPPDLSEWANKRGLPVSGTILTVLLDRATDEDLIELTVLKDIYGLRLDGSPVTDAGLARLKGLTKLRWLSLGRTRVTDAGMEHLKGLTRLKYLSVNRTAVTQKGIADLKQALPDLYIDGSLMRVRVEGPKVKSQKSKVKINVEAQSHGRLTHHSPILSHQLRDSRRRP